MNRNAHWILIAGSALAAMPALAADYEVNNSAELQSALSDAAESPENDRIVLTSGTTFPTINGQPFSYYSTGGGDLSIEAETGAILDGQNLTEILSLRRETSAPSNNAEDTTRFSLTNITFQDGRGSDDPRKSAGLAAYGANTVIEGSSFENNTGIGGDTGAAIYFDGGRNYTLTVSDTKINNNTASTSTRSSVSYIYHAKAFIITTDSVIQGNQGNYGVFYLDDAPTTITENTLFQDNISKYGGTIYPTGSTRVKIESSSFINNEVTQNTGSGVLGYGNYQIEDSLFQGNKAPNYAVLAMNRAEGQYITNSRFVNNETQKAGVMRIGDTAGSAIVSNSLFQNNTVGPDNGVVSCSSTCEILNSIFTGNQGGASVHTRRTTASDTIIANSVFLGTNPVVGFSDSRARAALYNNFLGTSLPALELSQLILAGNIQNVGDPGLDATNDFSTLAGSVLIDAGTTDSSKVTLPETDIRGNARVAGDNVDIGWEEYGSTNTTPVITTFEFLSEGSSNLDLLQFRLEYQLADNEVLAATEFMTDETETYSTITLDNGIFEEVMLEGGPHTVHVKVTDTNGESASQELSIELSSLDTLEIMDRIEATTKDLCADKPIECGIDTAEIREEGYNAGEEAAITTCLDNPENCGPGLDITPYVAQGREEGKQLCIDNPEVNCGIEVTDGSFDTNLIPNMGEGWKLFGTGQDITNLNEVFAGATIVWALQNNEWRAFSSETAVLELLEQSNVLTLQTIPANTGFWVKK